MKYRKEGKKRGKERKALSGDNPMDKTKRLKMSLSVAQQKEHTLLKQNCMRFLQCTLLLDLKEKNSVQRF